MFIRGSTDIDKWLKTLDTVKTLDTCTAKSNLSTMDEYSSTTPNSTFEIADEPRFTELDSPKLMEPLPKDMSLSNESLAPRLGLPTEPGTYGRHDLAVGERPSTPLSPVMNEEAILRELDSLAAVSPGAPPGLGADFSYIQRGLVVPSRQRTWSIGSMGSDNGMMGISTTPPSPSIGTMVPYSSASVGSPSTTRRTVVGASERIQGIDGISAEFLESLSATESSEMRYRPSPPTSYAAAGPGSIVKYSPAAAAASASAAAQVKVKSEPGLYQTEDVANPDLEHAIPTGLELGVIPDNLHELNDTQLAYCDYKTLSRLMVKAKLTEAQTKEVKTKRRKLKNRRSAKMCSGKKKVHVAQTREQNAILAEALTQLQRENRELKTDLETFKSALDAANADRAAMTEKIRLLESIVATSRVL